MCKEPRTEDDGRAIQTFSNVSMYVEHQNQPENEEARLE